MVESTAKILRIQPLCANLTNLYENEMKKFFCAFTICDHMQKSSKCENGNLLLWDDEIEFQYTSGEPLKASLWVEDNGETIIGKGEFQLMSLGEGKTEQWITLFRDEERVGELKIALLLICPKIEENKPQVLPEVVIEQESSVETHEIINQPMTDVEQHQNEAKIVENEHDWEVLQSRSPQTNTPEIIDSSAKNEEKYIPPEESRQIVRAPTEPQNPLCLFSQVPLNNPYQPSATQSSDQLYQYPTSSQPSMAPGQYYPQQSTSQSTQSNLQENPNPIMHDISSQINTQSFPQNTQGESHPIPQVSTEASAQSHQEPLQTTEGQTDQHNAENQGQVFQSGPQTSSQPSVQSTPAQAYPTGAQMMGQPYGQIPQGPQYYQPQMPGQYGQPCQPMSQYYNQPYQPIPNQGNQPYQPIPQQLNQQYQQAPQNPNQSYQNPSQPYQNPGQPYQNPSQPYQNISQPYQGPSQPYQIPNQYYQNPGQPFPNPQTPQSYLPSQPLPPPMASQNQQGQMPMQPNFPPVQQYPPNISAGMPSGFNQGPSGQPIYPPAQGYPPTTGYIPQGVYQQPYPYPQFQNSPQGYQNTQYPPYQMPYGYAPYPPTSQSGQPQGSYPPVSSAQQPTSYVAYPPFSSNPNQRN